LTNNVVEPRVCGPSIGVTPVALLVAVLFWTGVWGVVGLVLATPLTVCLAVLGKHVPQLGLLGGLLGSRAALRPGGRHYPRRLAHARYEAGAGVKGHRAARPADRLFDEVLVPALVLARRGRREGAVGPEDEQFILNTTRELVEGLAGPDGPAEAAGDGRPPV